MSNHPLMKCGCTANSVCHKRNGVKYAPPIPACLLHDCYEIADVQVDLSNRKARCSYLGSNKPNRRYANDECNYGCKGKLVCECSSIPSSFDLPFFKYEPDSEKDVFYCGCKGWN